MIHWDRMPSSWHADYERGRPSYPVEAVHVAAAARPEPELAVLLDEVRSRLRAEEYLLPYETLVCWTRLVAR